jgi:ribose transport system permease protein
MTTTSATSNEVRTAKGARHVDLSRYTQQAGLIAVIILLAVVFQSGNDAFLSEGNLIEVLRSGTLYFIVACATTLLLVAGGLDFSIGAVFALCAVVAGWLMTHSVPWPVAVLLGVAVGVGIGLLNAAAAIYLKIPPLIATLAISFVAGGLAFIITGGLDIFGFPETFVSFGGGSLLGLPVLIYYAVLIGLAFHVLLERTIFGYNARCIGGNRAAALANGIRLAKMDFALYALSGGVAAFAGILGAARLSTASPTSGGTSFTFQVLTAVIIGGTSLFGGKGTIAGAALGSLLFAVINNGLQVIDVNPLYQGIIVGVILALAVAVDQFRRSRQFA